MHKTAGTNIRSVDLITASNVTTPVNYVVNKNNTEEEYDNYDIIRYSTNSDGTIDIGDVTGVINIINQ